MTQLKFPLERLVNFSDAVVAIAITLLVLPLVDEASSLASLTSEALWSHFIPKILLFVVSFLVISKFWLVHRAIFQPIKNFTMPLFWLNVIWLLSIVFIPFTTELISSGANSGGLGIGIYIGTLFITAFTGLLMQYEIARQPIIWTSDEYRQSLTGGVATTGLIGIALIIAIIFPSVGLLALLLLLFSGIVTKLLNKAYR
jgi:uncharacterized membrane protein